MAQIDKPNLHFNTKLYTGNGSTNAITGVGFQPDWVWIKNRSTTNSHVWTDAVRGASSTIYSNSADAQDSSATNIGSFDSDGFTLGSNGGTNGNGNDIVSWNWKAGGSGSANSNGTLASTVSVNTAAGFSIVKYTGNGSAGATVGHGLGAKPNVIILKSYENGQQWAAYWSVLGATKYMRFNTTNAEATSNARWYDTEPTTSVFSIGNDGEVNTNTEDHIAYCFAEKKGFSSFGSYVANNNASGPFVYTGFKPAWLMIKKSSATENWVVLDNKRDIDNTVQNTLLSNTSNTEFTGTDRVDFLSNGFKCRNATGGINDGGTFIYMAFAENPIVGSNNVPAVAR